jgi:LPXTG-motif cell wall-anchored protein
MKKLIVIGATAFAAIFVALGSAPSAYADPETSCSVTVSAQQVLSGSELQVTAESQQTTTNSPRTAVVGTHWSADFNGVTKSGVANVFKTSFAVPTVTAETTLVLTVHAVMPDATTNCEKSLNITVEPSGLAVNPPNHLPNTGGPSRWFLIFGAALVLIGGAAVQQGRSVRTDRRLAGAHAA